MRKELCPGLPAPGSILNWVTNLHLRDGRFADWVAVPSTSQQHGLFWRTEHIIPDRHGTVQHAGL